MSMDLVAVAVAREGYAEQVRDACAAVTDRCRAERGSLDFRVLVQTDDPRTVVFFERWATAEDFAAHGAAPHVTRLQSELDGLLEGPMTVHLYAPGTRTEAAP